MKKLDIIILVAIIVVSLSLIGGYFFVSTNSSDTILVEYNNEIIYEIIDGSAITKLEIISVDDNTIEISIYRNSNVDIKSLKVDSIINQLDYQIEINNNSVVVTRSNCKNKHCMAMKLSNTIKSPIICTDGLVIKYKNNLDMDIITGE